MFPLAGGGHVVYWSYQLHELPWGDVMWKPVERRTLAEAVFDELKRQIVARGVEPGDALPAERRLSTLFEVNRNAVREALKRLEQARLVSIQHGGVTRVLDYVRHAGLDLLVHLITDGPGQLNHDALVGMTEMRTGLAPDIARRAARQASVSGPEGYASSDAAHAAFTCARQMQETDDLRRRMELSWAFWEALIDASGNLPYRLIFNTTRDAGRVAGDLLVEVLHDELADPDVHRELAVAVMRGDATGAATLAFGLCERSERRAARLLAETGAGGPGRVAGPDPWPDSGADFDSASDADFEAISAFAGRPGAGSRDADRAASERADRDGD